MEMTDREEFEEQSRQRCGALAWVRMPSRRCRGGRASCVVARNPRWNDRSEGGVTLIAENTWRNTRGPRLERLERKPRDLSLIGGARPVDWPTRARVYLAATLLSLVDLRSARIRRGIVRPRRVSRRTPLGPPADWQRNQTEIGLRRSISSPEEIRNGSNRRASRSTSSFLGRVTSLAISHCRCVTLFGVFH